MVLSIMVPKTKFKRVELPHCWKLVLSERPKGAMKSRPKIQNLGNGVKIAVGEFK